MKKGITLAVLSIVILVMVIFATAVTTTGSMALNNSKKLKFASEIALVQELLNEYASNKNGEYPTSSTISVDLSNVTESSITQFDDEEKNGNIITLYEIDFSLLGKTDLIYGTKEDGDTTDIYAVSETTGKVYYLKGVKVSKITYYTLTDDLKQAIGYTSNTGAITKDGIVFSTLETKWTNSNIDSTVKVPNKSEYTSVTVSVLQTGITTKTVAISETTSDYNIYQISEVAGNYDVEVTYTKNSISSTQTFSVTNFDDQVPNVTVNEIKDLINEEENIKQIYVSLDIESDISGIKHAKYETENILDENAKQYFNSNGMNIYNNTIVVDADTEYITIFVQDEAGNYTMRVLTFDLSRFENQSDDGNI